MKLHFQLFYLVFLILSCKTQTVFDISVTPENRIVRDNYYMKDINNYNDTFVDVWKWENGSDSYEITLQEFEMYSNPVTPNRYRDAIYGKYKYIVNSNIVSIIDTIDTFPNFKVSLIYNSPIVYSIVIDDVISNTSRSGTFTLTNADTAVLELKPRTGLIIENQANGEFVLPTNVTLTKQ